MRIAFISVIFLEMRFLIMQKLQHETNVLFFFFELMKLMSLMLFGLLSVVHQYEIKLKIIVLFVSSYFSHILFYLITDNEPLK